MKESELLSYAHTCLKQSGLVFWRVPNGPVFHSIGGRVIRKCSPVKGFPDLAGVFPSGKFWAIELKTDKGRLSPEQKDWIKYLEEVGYCAKVCKGADDAKEQITAFFNQHKDKL